MSALRRLPTQPAARGFTGGLASLSRASITNRGLAPTIAMAARLIAQTTAIEYVMISKLSDSLEWMTIQSLWGWRGGAREGTTVEIEPESISAYALLSGIAIIEDVRRQERPRAHSLMRDNSVVGAAEAAIRNGHAPIGVIGVYSARPLDLDPDMLDFLRAAANVLALAFERDRGGATGTAPDKSMGHGASTHDAWFKAVFESSSEAIAVIVPRTLRCLAMNRSLAELMGVAPEALVGRSIQELNVKFQAATIADLIELARLRGRLDECVCEIGVAGSFYPALASFVSHTTDAEPVVLMFVRRLSARIPMEAQLKRALADSRLKSRIIADSSHEIRTPLNIILGYSELIADYLRESGDRSHSPYIDAVRRAGKRLRETIDELLDYSRIDPGAFEPRPQTLDLTRLIADTIKELAPLADNRRVEISCDFENPAALYFDLRCLSRGFAHALKFAIRAAAGPVVIRLRYPESALAVEISARMSRAVQDSLTAASARGCAECEGSLEDASLDYELARHYFETGGAFIDRNCEQGTITLTIRFRSQDRRQNGRTSEAAMTPNPWTLRRSRILVVSAEMQSHLRAMLEPAYEVAIPQSIAETLRTLESSPYIDLVLIDLASGEKETGLSLVRTIRAGFRWKRLPIIALTSYATPENRGGFIAAGCDAVLSRPADRDALANLITELLRTG